MVSKNEIRVGVKFDVDNKQLDASKQKINDLLSSLQKIQTDFQSAKILGEADKDFEKAAQEAKKLERILKDSWNSKLGQLDLSKFNNSLKQSYGTVGGLRNQLKGAGTDGVAAFNNIASSVLNSNRELKQTSTLLDKMALTMANTVRFGISSSIFNSLTGAISKAYNYSVDLDKSLNNIRIVSGQSADQMERFAKYANDAAKQLGSSTLDYTDASLIYYQQGLSEKEVLARTDVTIKAANVLGTSAEEVSQYLTAIWNNFDDGSKSLEYYADVITALGASTASSAEEISQGLEKFAAVGETVGLSYEYATTALATITATTRQSADTVGTALKTLFSRIQDLELGETLEDGTTLGKYSKALEKVGINIMDQNGNLKQMDTILDEMGAKWGTLNSAQKTALAQNVAGVRQYTQLVALMDNWDKFGENLKVAYDSAGTLQEQQDIYMESTEAHLKKIRAEAEKTYDILFDTDAVNSMADSVSGLMGIMNSFLTGLGGGTNALTFFGATFASIFNKQIGGALERQIENFEAFKNNLAGEKLKEQFAAAVTSRIGMEEGNWDPSNKRVQLEANIAQRLSAIQSTLSPQRQRELTDLQKQMGFYEELVDKAENYTKYLQDANEKENISLGFLEDKVKIANQELEAQKEIAKYIEIQSTQASSNDRAMAQRIREEFKDPDYFLKGMGSADQEAILQELEQSGSKIFSKADSADLLQRQNELIAEQEIRVKNLTNAYQGKKALEDGSVETYKAYNEEGEKELQRQERLSQRQQALSATVQLLTTAVQIGTVFSGILRTINNDSLSAGEKVQAIATTLLTSAPMILGAIASLNKILPSLVLKLKLVSLAEGEVAVSAGAAWSAILGPLALIIAGIAGVVGIINALNDAYHADENAAKRAAEATKEAKQSYEECAAAAKELKEQISDYTEALVGLEELTKGTDEYAESLEETNNKAKELIKTLGLYNDYRYENGAIVIDEEALQKAQANANHATYLAENNYITKQIESTNANLKAQQTQLARTTGNRIADVWGGVGSYTTGGDVAQRASNEAAMKQISEMVVSVLNEVRDFDENRYNEITANRENFDNWLKELDTGNDFLQKYHEEISEQVNEFESLATSTRKATEANNQYASQINLNAVQSLYGEQIRALSYGANGQVDQARFNQISEIINNSDIQQLIAQRKQGSRNVLANTSMNNRGESFTNAEAWSREFSFDNKNTAVTNLLKNSGVSSKFIEGLIGTSNLENDQDLARAYAKLRNIDLSNALYAEGKYTDQSGNTLVDVSSASKRGAIRENIFSSVYNASQDKALDEAGKISTDAILENLNTIVSQAKEAGNQFGADFSQSMLDYISNQGGELNLASLGASIDPKELEQLQKMSPEEIQAMFGITDESLSEFGDLTAEEFANSFKNALEQIEWNPTEAVQEALYGKDTELEKLGIDKDEIADYSEYLMDVANGAEDASGKLDELADEMEYNAKSAVTVAKSIMRMNSGIEKLTKDQEDWIDILQHSERASEEYFDALRNIQDAMGDLLDLSEDTAKYLDGDFFAKNAELIAQAAEGDAEAIDKLRDATEEAIILKIAIDNELDSNAMETLNYLREDIQSKIQDIKVGVELDISNLEEGEEGLINACNEIISTAQMTAEQARSFFESIGFEPTFVTEEQTANSTKPITMTVTEDAGSYDQEHEDGSKTHFTRTRTYSYIDGYIDVPERIQVPALSSDGKVPQIQKLTKKGTGASNNYSSKNKGGGSAGGKKSSGGGGSTKEPNKMDPLEEEADRYHQVNTQITKVENALKKLTSQEEKFVGAKLIDNLNKQWTLLNTQVDNYNEKLRIARDEQEELRQSLAAQGTEFNADGTISNYMEVFAAKQNYVNSLIDRYNSMSAEEQESYKDTVEKAKEDFKEFQKDLDRYDTLVSNEIPNLSQSIQDALDKQIELNIKKFNMEVTLTLDMAEAERDWNKWKAKVLDGIKESDILGNAQARLQDFSSYYDSAAAGSIQVQSRHLEDTLDELRKMDNGIDNVYGDNRTQALEDLQTYYKQLMEDLEGVLDLQTEIHQAYLDMMDEAQDKFSEQLETYSMIGDLLNNNMKVVQLIYGEDAYGQLSNYYQQQYDNNMAQLDFLRQQKQLWADQMELFEEGSEEWQSAKEKWMDAANELSSTLTDALDTARESFENTIKEIFQDLNNLVTDNLGLDYVNEEWELINRNADRYLDSVNAIAGIRSLESKYLDSINDAINPKNQQRLNALMNSELTTLKSMDKLSQADLDRAELKYQIALAQIALEDAQQQKSQMRLRRDTQGNYTYQYTADEDAINKARENLNKLYVDLYNFDKEQYRTNLDDIYKTWEEYQQKMAEAALINDPELRAQRELLIQQEYNELLNGMLEQNTAFRLNLEQSSYMSLNQMYQDDLMNFTTYTQAERDTLLNELGGAFNSLLEVYGINVEAFKEMTIQEQNDIIENLGTAFTTLSGFYNEDVEKFNQLAEDHQVILVEKMVPQWESAIQAMADKISGEGGLAQTTEDAMNKIKDATAEYDKQVELLANTAEKTTTEIGKGLDNDINKTQQLVKDNTQLINAYDNELKAVKNVCDQIDELIKKYGTAETAAKKATEAAYKYWLQEQQKNASAAKAQTNTTSNANSSNVNTNTGANATNVASTSAAASSQGNGNIDLGDKVTLNGKISSSSYNNPGLTPISKYRGAQLYVQMINEGKPSPYHLGTSPNYSSSTAVGWTNKDQITGYDTGGYTGTWNNNSRLAFLHQKELVLNANDTANMLNAVTIMRNLANNLGENILAKLAGVTAGKGSAVGGDGSLEQNVHIEATFPGVKDAKEIEDALNNLVNSASQRAFEKR